MARNPCGCVGTECSCKIVSTDGSINVMGKGTAAQPYDLSNDQGHFTVVDTPTVDLTKSGDGSSGNPYTISAVATVATTELTDVSATAPTVGQVLAWDGSIYRPTPPVTAAVGSINHDTTLKGDGSSVAPLGVNLDPNGLLQGSGNGVGLSPSAIAAINRAIRPIPAPIRVTRPSPYMADSFLSQTWTGVLGGGDYQGLGAGWYDISGAVATADGGYGQGQPMLRGTEGVARLSCSSAGGPRIVVNNATAIAGYPEGQRADYWTGAALSWSIKGTFHHTGGVLGMILELIMLRDASVASVFNNGTFLTISCISLD